MSCALDGTFCTSCRSWSLKELRDDGQVYKTCNNCRIRFHRRSKRLREIKKELERSDSDVSLCNSCHGEHRKEMKKSGRTYKICSKCRRNARFHYQRKKGILKEKRLTVIKSKLCKICFDRMPKALLKISQICETCEKTCINCFEQLDNGACKRCRVGTPDEVGKIIEEKENVDDNASTLSFD